MLVEDALTFAHRALEFTEEMARTRYPIEREYVRNHWLLGAAHRVNRVLDAADHHLTAALTRCRNINMADHEADILLELARLRVDQAAGAAMPDDLRAEALRLAQEALIITERSGYVLQSADVNLFLAAQAKRAGDLETARQHANKALKLAYCDGPPDYTYKVAYEEAKALVAELGG